MLVEKLVSKTSVEALNDGILVRLARFDEMQLDAGVSAPLEQFSAGEFRAMVRLKRGRCPRLERMCI